MNKQALAVVYDADTKKVYVVHEYGLLDITPFYKELNVRPASKGVHCDVEGTMIANYISRDPE